jgi:hypothetical protein
LVLFFKKELLSFFFSRAPFMTEASDSDLMGQFISMGLNCEFGVAQRKCHAEPPDLFRWGNTPIAVALHMLRDRFEHIAEPSALEIVVTGGEYNLINTHYGFTWHTFAMEKDMSAERVLRREIARLPRQADILMDDMAEGQRVLLRAAQDGVRDGDIAAFVEVCGSFGPCHILYVSEDAAQAGTVQRCGQRLLRGYVERFVTGDVAKETQPAPWVRLCRAAWALMA